MQNAEPETITRLLRQWGAGDRKCLDQLLPLVEAELHRIARHHMRKERRGHTLQTTALINEAYLRLVDQSGVQLQNRVHFFAIAARIMRQIPVDHARGLSREKRGGQERPLPLENELVFAPAKSSALVALDEALSRLAERDSRKAQVVELRYFGGLSVEEVAIELGVHANTVVRDWSLSKAWLKREIERSG